ncbi:hypothetical protein ASG72_01335 [Bosea sp. Leaf344]|uniref:type II toxin-antitoxin system ParD family antitoxin n=1 Tax=Bosea sp. Leaf344 TaxID=1736346 RepID=UPI0006F2F62D|nr:hypothetical protein [Bosea sp. Leaf344]KQU54322.1 hypothetical protein ASG72_01335 [Bosea sp. Leaf344]
MRGTIELEEDDEAFVTSLVAVGRYESPDAVIQQAVKLVRLRKNDAPSCMLRSRAGSRMPMPAASRQPKRSSPS